MSRTCLDELEEVRRVNRAQSILVDAVQELSLARTVPAIQAVVRRAARAVANADGATFVLKDGDNCHYADEDAISPLWKGRRFPLKTCISGWAMLHRRPAVVPDIYSDARIPVDAYRPTFVKSLVMVPIRVDEPVGAIGVYWAKQRTASAEEISILQALANTTSVAMENVRVYTELEHRVTQRTEQLEALNRELEAFSYSVSHDLRGPLRGIGGFMELYAREVTGPQSEQAQRYLTQVLANVRKMNGLIDGLLQLARGTQQELRRAEVDLADIARTIAERLRAEHPHRKVELVIAEKLPANCDAELFGVVLENLLSNAWKYTSKRTVARIEVGAETHSPNTIYFVRDNGAGFSSEHAEKLFAPFQRLHSSEEFPGFGVGLATVRRIITRHGGRIWATAEADKGATFRFTCTEECPK